MKRLIIAASLALLSPAFAQAAPEQSIWPTIIMFGGMFVLMYFMIIRPNKKRANEHAALINSLKVGNEVMLHSGLVGRIQALGENYIALEVANNVVVRVQRQSIGTLLPKGSYKGDLT